MKLKSKFIGIILLLLIFVLIGGYLTSNLIQLTYATNKDYPNVIITINRDGSISNEGDLFHGQLYPATVNQVENGTGGINGVIRIINNYKRINVENIAIGLKDLVVRNSYSEKEVYKSFLDNVRLKVDKGHLFVFDKPIIDYTNLGNLLYEQDSQDHKGYILDENDQFRIPRGKTIDLKYSLHMLPEAGNELQKITVNMPIYINLMGNREEKPREDTLSKKDHVQYNQGHGITLHMVK